MRLLQAARICRTPSDPQITISSTSTILVTTDWRILRNCRWLVEGTECEWNVLSPMKALGSPTLNPVNGADIERGSAISSRRYLQSWRKKASMKYNESTEVFFFYFSKEETLKHVFFCVCACVLWIQKKKSIKFEKLNSPSWWWYWVQAARWVGRSNHIDPSIVGTSKRSTTDRQSVSFQNGTLHHP